MKKTDEEIRVEAMNVAKKEKEDVRPMPMDVYDFADGYFKGYKSSQSTMEAEIEKAIVEYRENVIAQIEKHYSKRATLSTEELYSIINKEK